MKTLGLAGVDHAIGLSIDSIYYGIYYLWFKLLE